VLCMTKQYLTYCLTYSPDTGSIPARLFRPRIICCLPLGKEIHLPGRRLLLSRSGVVCRLNLTPEMLHWMAGAIRAVPGRDGEVHGGLWSGEPTRRDPLDVLVQTILSQNTTDVNSRRAFTRLKERFPSWEDVARAPATEVAAAIAPAGLGPTRARRIRDILEQLTRERGRPDLSFLEQMPSEAACDYLLQLHGVGPKTAACVLLFALGRPVFPVDTHIHRIMRRLGLIPERSGPQEAQRLCVGVVPPDLALPLHLGLIEHGRRICRPRRPECHRCPLDPRCPRRGVASGGKSPGRPRSGEVEE